MPQDRLRADFGPVRHPLQPTILVGFTAKKWGQTPFLAWSDEGADIVVGSRAGTAAPPVDLGALRAEGLARLGQVPPPSGALSGAA